MKEEIVSFTNKYLKNTNGKLEGQRIKKQWFDKNCFEDMWNKFENANITNTQTLYNYIYNTTELCQCGNPRRFTGFKHGYVEFCEQCARTNNNWMKKQCVVNDEPHDVDFVLREEAKLIINTLKTSTGKFSTSKIKKLSDSDINIIYRTTFYLKDKFSERLYHIDNDMFSIPLCEKCNQPLDNFVSSAVGYQSKFCSSNGCAQSEGSKGPKENSLKYHYQNHAKRFESNEEYSILFPTFEEYKREKRNSQISFIHNECGHEYKYNLSYQGSFKCPKCFPIRSKKQHEIYDMFKQYNPKFNDRQLIKPKELDILFDTFAIEYDSLSYHSYGYHAKKELNNTVEQPFLHVEKTESCEQQGIQLFRIFSNEWVHKKDVWVSVINSKLNNTKKIYARNCVVSSVDHQTSTTFLETNHLQGKATASVRLGLYYEGELVSLMTFGKSRYSKTYEYELIRFCSILNTTIVGGASKLLKYFERNYKPKSIISYANRRWSQGNLYEKLGFDFSHNTSPNYFYYRGNDYSTLLSRVQFQKHKLKDIFNNYNEKLTSTENMYNNGYRKIYDCGNKVYVKTYY